MEGRRRFSAPVKRDARIGILTVLVLTGTAFLLYGVFSGQAAVVLKKAIRICMECIGIG